MMVYLVDADVFIQAKNLHYAPEFCPAFWDWLIQQNRQGRVFSIKKVAEELVAGGDYLSEWAKDRGAGFFLPPDEQVLGVVPRVIQWATNRIDNPYRKGAVDEFAAKADSFLIAHASGHGYRVVTNEKPKQLGKKVVKIPDVCAGLKVKCVTPWEMLCAEHAHFVLGKSENSP